MNVVDETEFRSTPCSVLQNRLCFVDLASSCNIIEPSNQSMPVSAVLIFNVYRQFADSTPLLRSLGFKQLKTSKLSTRSSLGTILALEGVEEFCHYSIIGPNSKGYHIRFNFYCML